MMKSMIAENGVTFKELEKNIYKWICHMGQNFTKEFLERYDQMLMKQRERPITVIKACARLPLKLSMAR